MRHARIIYPGFPHHVIVRGNNRRRLFSYPRDYRAFIRHLAQATARHEVDLHHACLMQNHVHLIATPNAIGAMAGWVHAFAQRYARFRNDQREASGKLFEERFRSFALLDDAYLEVCTAYVELNPVRAGVVQRPADYPWSTRRVLGGGRGRGEFPSWSLTPSPFFVGLGSDAPTRAGRFVRWLDEMRARPRPVLPEKHDEAARMAEALSAGYALRLERPDGTRCD